MHSSILVELKKIVFLAFLLMFLLLAMVVRLTNPLITRPVETELLMEVDLPVHNIDSGKNFSTIQEAINDNETLDGHTILVDAGTYYEHVVVSKSLSLVGENKDTTIIDGRRNGDEVTVIANNVVVKGFTVQNSTPYLFGRGIIISNSSNCYVHGNKVSNNFYGILLDSCTNCSVYDNIVTHQSIIIGYSWNCSLYGNVFYIGSIILDYSSNCHIYSNTGASIELRSSSNCYVHDNIVNGRPLGISLDDSSNCTLRNNTMTNNTYNFDVHGDSLREFIHDIDASNTINGKRVRYLVNQKNLTINLSTYPDIGYLAVVNSTLITVEDLALEGNLQGVLLAYVTNSTVKNITATSNSHGIRLSHSSNFSVFDNTLARNERGISLVYCFNGSLYTNTLTKNNIAICVWHSSNISVYGNNATDNSYYANCGGIHLLNSSNCFVYNNDLISNNQGIYLEKSSNNHVYGNNIKNSKYSGIETWQAWNNTIFHNNFIQNGLQARVLGPNVNFWDDDYPSGGNYWSDYIDVDQYSGSYQNETGSDGIWDHPYIIDENNQDNYPIVPEFPTWTPMLLLLIILTIAIAIYKRRLLKTPIH
jgi:parallel beta-helix repeat protein